MDAPQGKKRVGCLGCLFNLLLGCVALVLALVGCAYIVVMHTSLPFKVVASSLERATTNVNLQITGVSGSVASGFGVKAMRWTGGEIADVRVQYSGFRDWMSKQELILHEVHIGKAHLDITDWKSNTASTNATPASTSSAWPLKLFQLDRLTFQDVVLTNCLTGFSLAIPALEWTGFKVAQGTLDLGQLKMDSDRLKITTKPALSAGFQKLVEATLLPKLHPAIRRPIDLMAEVGCMGSHIACRVRAFGGQLAYEMQPDHTGLLNCTELDLADYFDAPLPQKLTVKVAVAAASGQKTCPIKLQGGSFVLGVSTFVIPEQGLSATNVLLAVSRAADAEFRYELIASDEPPHIRQRLSAQPALPPKDTVALVFFGKRSAELSAAEQREVTQKLPTFSPELK